MSLDQQRDDFFNGKTSHIKPAPKVSIQVVTNDALTPTQAAINALLANVEAVDIRQACERLGWFGKKDDYPCWRRLKIDHLEGFVPIEF